MLLGFIMVMVVVVWKCGDVGYVGLYLLWWVWCILCVFLLCGLKDVLVYVGGMG